MLKQEEKVENTPEAIQKKRKKVEGQRKTAVFKNMTTKDLQTFFVVLRLGKHATFAADSALASFQK